MKIKFFFLIIVCLSCKEKIYSYDKIIDIPPPRGCERIILKADSYSAYLRGLKLKKDRIIMAYNGDIIRYNYNTFAVVQKPLLFKSDLEQCADYAMRFWADYHRDRKKLGRLYLFNYPGQKKYFQKSGKSFTSFLRYAMAYSNSFSIKRGCSRISCMDLMPGDMFVQNKGGGIGHVSVVLDTAVDKMGRKYHLVGFSFMPAQEFHVEYGSDGYGKAGWFTCEGFKRYLLKYYNYGKPVLRRFE